MAIPSSPWMLLVTVVVCCSAGALGAPSVQPSIAQAEARLNELSQIMSDIKNSIRSRHCEDLRHAGQRLSGVYTIFPLGADPNGQTVHCDMDTDGGGWTVIQRRGQFGNNAYYFYRNWTEYATGFGDPAKEYWIGNKALHALTASPEEMALRIQLTNGTGETVSVEYETFRVGSEDDFFQLELGKHLGPPGWDALSDGHQRNFTTFDRDNDRAPHNCAVTFRGAWWHRDCHQASLNGLNLNGAHDSFADGIEWSRRGVPGSYYHYSYPRVTMMIRPVGSQIDKRSNTLT